MKLLVDKKKAFAVLLTAIMCLFCIILDATWLCRVCVIFLVIVCIYKGLFEKTLLNPYFLFSLTPISLLLCQNLGKNYMLDLSTSTWVLAIINISAFLIAFDFTSKKVNVQKCIGFSGNKQLVKNTYILLFLGFLPTMFRMAFHFEMPLASIFSLFSTPAIVCAMKSKNKTVIISVFCVFVFSWVGYVSKTSVLSTAIAILICYEKYYIKTKKQKIKLIVFSGLALLVMIAAFSFANQDRGSSTADEVVEYYSKYGNISWNHNDALLMPYLYLTTPWTNLQYVTETQSTHTYGLWFFKPILGYLQLDKFFSNSYSLTAYSNFNTYTFIAYCFKDFGYFGSMISSAFLGFFCKKIYSRYSVSCSPLDVACYVLVGQAILEMFFSNHFYSQSYPFTIVLLMGIYKFVFCRKGNLELENTEKR